jgi:toxin ParE1/3/4
MSKSNNSVPLPLAYHPEASQEAVEASSWYLRRSKSVAADFQSELDRAAGEVTMSPMRWEKYKFGTRRFFFSGFPYLLVYRVTAEHIEIIAIAHGSRRPGYWRSRLKG